MSRGKSMTKSGWRKRDLAFRDQERKRRNLNAAKRKSYALAVELGQVNERSVAISKGEPWPTPIGESVEPSEVA